MSEYECLGAVLTVMLVAVLGPLVWYMSSHYPGGEG